MTINSVYMKDFGNVQEQSLEFSSGLTLFSGNNGEGKSTVLRCLSLLLFNQTTAKLSDYIRWGTEEFSISTDIQHLGKHLKISFVYSEKSSDREVIDLDTGESYKNTAALTFLDELFDTKRALASIISFENEIDLITTSPSERREYLKRIYDLNFKSQLASINSDKIESENESLRLTGEINALELMTFEKLLFERLPCSEDVYEEKKKNLSALLELRSSLIRQKEEEETTRKKLEDFEFELFKLNKKHTTHLDTISSQRDELEKLKQEYSELALDTSSIEYEKTEEEGKLKNQIFNLNTRLFESNYSLNDIKIPELNEDRLMIPETKESNYNYRFKIEALEKQIRSFESGVCPTCNQRVDESYQKNFKEELVLLKEFYEDSKKLLADNERKLLKHKEALEKAVKSKSSLERSIADDTSLLASLKKDLSHLEDKYESKIALMTSEFAHLKESISAKIKELENSIRVSLETEEMIAESKQKLTDDIQVITTSLKSLVDIIPLLEEKNSSINVVESEIKLYESITVSNEEKRKLNEAQDKKELERTERLNTSKKELLASQEKVSLAEFANKILSKEFPSYVISKMISTLTFHANEFLSKVYPSYTLTIVESKSSIRVLYGPNGSDVKLASGFEQQIFSFAWKYALGKLQNYNILILDEVDSAASEANSEKFYSTLAKMDDCFQQVFVVTHKQDIKDLLATDFGATVYEVVQGTYQSISS